VTRHHRVASAAHGVERPVGGVFHLLFDATVVGYFLE
jgi:hypothetical protein